jgi:hypothetical protein
MGGIDERSDTAKLDRFVSTYAGYTQESELLESLYDQVVRDGERIHPKATDLCQ